MVQLRDVRRIAGFTQVELAARLGVTQSRVSQLERADLQRLEVGTVLGYLAALGADLELAVDVTGERVVLAAERGGGASGG